MAEDEIARASVRNILRMHGLPETAPDGLQPREVLAHVRAVRLFRELANEPDEGSRRDC
jgi:hypothetical protein